MATTATTTPAAVNAETGEDQESAAITENYLTGKQGASPTPGGQP